MAQPNVHQYTVLVFPEDDAWVAFVPALDIATQGDDRDHAFQMAQEAIELWLEVAIERGEEIPVEQGEASLRQIVVGA
ncbi:MAG: type II toxin-antitoxin system HicB family antitoxin [Chloroflexia bacterium]|nr:type II toxin-antitoxin system HicB family antitoxin [Chloroflexia bacterium]